MFIENVEKLNAASFADPELYHELMQIDDDIDRQAAVMKLRSKAKQFGMAKDFDNMYRAIQKSYSKAQQEYLINNATVIGDCMTDFSMLLPEEQFHCGDWIADDQGIRLHTKEGLITVCPHPIFPTKILRNAETGKFKVELTFQIRGKTRRIFVDRETIASPTKILKLANESVMVTARSAQNLIDYLASVEALNPELIIEYASTSRLGWIEDRGESGQKVKRFLPYQQNVIFDNELNTKSLFDSITEHGSREKWYELIKELRQKRQYELLVNLAASFASVLVDPCGALPFIVSLWGGTGIGKSVILKICTSVWADPGEGKYITDAKATTTAMEMRLNILNSLPMTLDDMAQIKNQYDEDFSELIYRWCAGKGRDRSNKELGLNKLTSWRNCILTNGERSLVDETTQGGAVNRVIDIEASGEVLFDGKSGNRATNTVEKNYGFAGREFISVIEELGFDSINATMNEFYDQIKAMAAAEGVEKEDKQIVPMALILAADKLTEQYLFKDDVRLDVAKCLSYLKNKGEVSEDKRAYDYLMDMIAQNQYRFGNDEGNFERWGFWEDDDMIAIFSTAFDRLMKDGGFQSKAFLSWAKKRNLLELGTDGRPRKGVSKGSIKGRAVVIRTNFEAGQESQQNDDDFVKVGENDDVPFT